MRLQAAVLSGLLLAGCSRPEPPPELVVFAASSLRDAFVRAHVAGGRVAFSIAGSQQLRAQLEGGAEADVFAPADERTMDALQAEGLVRERRRLTCNSLAIAVPRGNPEKVRGIEDLRRLRRIVLGAPEVPVGQYTRQVLERAAAKLGDDFRTAVEARVVSREPNVRQALAKVAFGEADAAVVYRSDAAADPRRVELVPIPEELNVAAEYPIAVLSRSRHPELARAWVERLLSREVQVQLEALGFARCPEVPR